MKAKQFSAFFMTLTFILTLFIPILTLPTSAASPTFTSNKTVYAVGEPIYVTASSDNSSAKDWIGIAPASIDYAMRWDYLTTVGNNTQIDARNLGNPNPSSDFTPYMSFPAGDYIIYFIANDETILGALGTSKLLGKINITITNGNPEDYMTNPPSKVTYTLKDAASGLADGTLDITLPEVHNATDIHMWWANDNGKLDGYTMLAKFKVPSGKTSFTYEMTPNTLIPKGATKLLIYTYGSTYGLSSSPFECLLPSNISYIDTSYEANVEFQVLSDIHIKENGHKHNNNFITALNDIGENSLDSQGIFVVGDMVDNGSNDSYWSNFWSIYDNVGGSKDLPHMYISLGNHEFWSLGEYNNVLKKFLSNLRIPDGKAKPTTAYYDTWIGDYQFIFLASTQVTSDGCHAVIGDAQYKWLEEKLSANKTDKPIFIFMHQSLKDTVAGSTDAEGWWGIEDDAKLRELLKKYPQICMFNGHSHWKLDSYTTMYGGKGDAAIFNTSSVGYLWDGYNKVAGEELDGSEGYYIKVFDDKILVLGRNFITGEWVSSAQFVISPPKNGDEIEEDEIIESETEPKETEPVTEQTEAETEATESDTTSETTSVAEKKGCKASLSIPIITLIGTGGAIIAINKKRKK